RCRWTTRRRSHGASCPGPYGRHGCVSEAMTDLPTFRGPPVTGSLVLALGHELQVELQGLRPFLRVDQAVEAGLTDVVRLPLPPPLVTGTGGDDGRRVRPVLRRGEDDARAGEDGQLERAVLADDVARITDHPAEVARLAGPEVRVARQGE